MLNHVLGTVGNACGKERIYRLSSLTNDYEVQCQTVGSTRGLRGGSPVAHVGCCVGLVEKPCTAMHALNRQTLPKLLLYLPYFVRTSDAASSPGKPSEGGRDDKGESRAHQRFKGA